MGEDWNETPKNWKILVEKLDGTSAKCCYPACAVCARTIYERHRGFCYVMKGKFEMELVKEDGVLG